MPRAVPSVFFRDGYRFVGWYEDLTNTGSRWSPNRTIRGGENIELFPRWVRTPHAPLHFVLGDTTGGNANGEGSPTGDGRVTSADTTQIARWLVRYGTITLTPDSPREHLAADINGDGYITVDDITLHARWLVGHNISELLAAR